MRSLLVLSLVAFGGFALWAGLAPAQVPPCDQYATECMDFTCAIRPEALIPAGGCLAAETRRAKEECVEKHNDAGFRTTGSQGFRDAPHRLLCPLVNDNIMTGQCGDLELATSNFVNCTVVFAGCGGTMVEPCTGS